VFADKSILESRSYGVEGIFPTPHLALTNQDFVMRSWRFLIDTLILSSQYNPPRFVELLMLMLAIVMLAVSTVIPEIPYTVLGLSLVVGASFSILVREAMAPSPQTRITQFTAMLLLFVSFYGFVDLLQRLL
jgi:hypothetical protein